jgi:hypothetical protein
LVRAADVVVVTPEVTVVRRRVVVVAAVAAGAAVAAATFVFADAAGWSGAFVFCTCVAAKAVMPERDVRVSAVATPRRIALERMSGAVLVRFCMSLEDHAGALGA